MIRARPLPPPRGLSGGVAGGPPAGPGGWIPAARATDLVISPRGARFLGRRFPCVLGRGGCVPGAAKAEGDGATPLCVTYARQVWRPASRPPAGGALPETAIGPDLGWGDDPALGGYNGPVRLSARGGRGAERMLRPDRLYRLVVETGWNADAPVPGRGSAIFLHVRKGLLSPTAGCAAFAEGDLRWILARWTRRSRIFFRP
ncbi:L,D-transpeptidase family protein [Rhodovulum sp. DZ06]|uniref:L,D-transpeptidase family protein n=1 Tax=Rhodovulum sp. DZ06 TaxID=3425126 RepID=UPI003D350187